jgi:hypothetical protein
MASLIFLGDDQIPVIMIKHLALFQSTQNPTPLHGFEHLQWLSSAWLPQ